MTREHCWQKVEHILNPSFGEGWCDRAVQRVGVFGYFGLLGSYAQGCHEGAQINNQEGLDRLVAIAKNGFVRIYEGPAIAVACAVTWPFPLFGCAIVYVCSEWTAQGQTRKRFGGR